MASDEKSVLIFGSGRSGTTWVQDSLAQANRYGTVFEPLHPRCVPGAVEFANRYVLPGSRNEPLYDFLRPFLVDGRHTFWTAERAHPDLLFPPLSKLMNIGTLRDTRKLYAKVLNRWWRNRSLRGRPVVAKFIRGNLMAEWVADTFDLPAAVVVRHPCAVLSSVSRRAGRDWQTDTLRRSLDRYLEQPDICRDLLGEKVEQVRSYRTLPGVQTAIWCIENRSFLAPGRSALHVAAYEDLVTGDADSWPELASALRLRCAPTEAILRKPSQQASLGVRGDVSADRQIRSWQQQLDESVLREVDDVLHLFGIDYYSVDSPLPRRSPAIENTA